MGYSEQFQLLRESRGLTREQLASRANCHRNTVMNVESGRPVRFATIVHLMRYLGYRKDSPEVRSLALLWLEAVTGIDVSPESANPAAVAARAPAEEDLPHEVRQKLTRADVELLTFAARNRKVLNALRAIRDVVQRSQGSRAV